MGPVGAAHKPSILLFNAFYFHSSDIGWQKGLWGRIIAEISASFVLVHFFTNQHLNAGEALGERIINTRSLRLKNSTLQMQNYKHSATSYR